MDDTRYGMGDKQIARPLRSSVVFYIDTTSTLQIVSPNNGDYLNNSDVTVTWQAYSAVGIAYYEIRMGWASG